MFTSSSFGEAAALLTCGRAEDICVNNILELKHSSWRYSCVIGQCPTCKDRFIACPAFTDTLLNCSWRAYQRVPKLGKNETVNEMGVLTSGKRKGQRPYMERQLTIHTGTRFQFLRAAQLHWRMYSPHNYEARWDKIMTETQHRVLLPDDILFESDFSAYPKLRAEKELTCQTGNRSSLYTTIATIGTKFDPLKGDYVCDKWTTSYLVWNDDCVQDHSMVHDYRSLLVKDQMMRHPGLARSWKRIIEVTDKCGSQFFSKSALRECAQWIQTAPGNLTVFIRVLHVTSHGCFHGDGEGGKDKGAVDRFIRDEKTWAEKINHVIKPPTPKPIVNCAKMAAFVAREMRRKTRYNIYIYSRLIIRYS